MIFTSDQRDLVESFMRSAMHFGHTMGRLGIPDPGAVVITWEDDAPAFAYGEPEHRFGIDVPDEYSKPGVGRVTRTVAILVMFVLAAVLLVLLVQRLDDDPPLPPRERLEQPVVAIDT